MPNLYKVTYIPHIDTIYPCYYSGSNMTDNCSYMGSPSDKCIYDFTNGQPLFKWWKTQVKNNPRLFKKEIVLQVDHVTGQELRILEMNWQTTEDHASDPKYFNKSNSSYTTPGSHMKPDNPNYETWKNNISKSRLGKVACKNMAGTVTVVDKAYFNSDSGLVGVNSGMQRRHIFRDNERLFVEEQQLNQYLIEGWNLGREVSEEFRNSTPVGTMWVNNKKTNKMIHPDDFQTYAERGYTKGRLSFKRNPAKETTCPHCGKVGRGGNMLRYHFNNCKDKHNE